MTKHKQPKALTVLASNEYSAEGSIKRYPDEKAYNDAAEQIGIVLAECRHEFDTLARLPTQTVQDRARWLALKKLIDTVI